MTDEQVIETILQAFGKKDLIPKRYGTRLSIKDGKFCHHIDRYACPVGALLAGLPTDRAKFGDDTDIYLYQLAADILGISVACAMGITVGFDSGKTTSTGPEDARGIRIGAEIADRLFPKTKKYMT